MLAVTRGDCQLRSRKNPTVRVRSRDGAGRAPFKGEGRNFSGLRGVQGHGQKQKHPAPVRDCCGREGPVAAGRPLAQMSPGLAASSFILPRSLPAATGLACGTEAEARIFWCWSVGWALGPHALGGEIKEEAAAAGRCRGTFAGKGMGSQCPTHRPADRPPTAIFLTYVSLRKASPDISIDVSSGLIRFGRRYPITRRRR